MFPSPLYQQTSESNVKASHKLCGPQHPFKSIQKVGSTDLFLLQHPFRAQQPENAAGPLPEAVPHHRLQLALAHLAHYAAHVCTGGVKY